MLNKILFLMLFVFLICNTPLFVQAIDPDLEINETVNMTKDSPFGNILLTIPKGFEKVEQGGQLLTNVKLMNLRSESRIDVILDFIIEDFEGRVILFKKETIAVETQANLIRTFLIPEDAVPGKYKVYVNLIYSDGNETVAEASFDVVKKKSFNNTKDIYIIAIICVVVIIGIIYFGTRARKIFEKIRLNIQIKRIIRSRFNNL